MAFGLIVLFENWRTVIGMTLGGLAGPGWNPSLAAAWGIGIGIVIAVVLVIVARTLEKWARNKYGPFVGE